MIDEDDDESEEAHSIICGLRTIVGRVLFGSDNDEREMECLLQQADAWVAAWRERRLKQETVREALARYGYLDEVMANMRDAFTSAPNDVTLLTEALDWTPTGARGRALRRVLDAFHRYAALVLETKNHRIDVRDLVQCMLVMVVG